MKFYKLGSFKNKKSWIHIVKNGYNFIVHPRKYDAKKIKILNSKMNFRNYICLDYHLNKYKILPFTQHIHLKA